MHLYEHSLKYQIKQNSKIYPLYSIDYSHKNPRKILSAQQCVKTTNSCPFSFFSRLLYLTDLDKLRQIGAKLPDFLFYFSPEKTE